MKIIGIDPETMTISTVVMDSDSLAVTCKRTINSDSFLPAQQPSGRIQAAQSISVGAKTTPGEILLSVEQRPNGRHGEN